MSAIFTICPPNNAVTNAMIGRAMAKESPMSEYVAMIESTPVCGVAMRNEATAPLLAPSLRSDIAVGITPHEQRGSGMPKRAE